MKDANHRAMFTEEIEWLSGNRDVVLKRLLTETDTRKRNTLILILRMVNAEMTQYRKGIQLIDGEISETDIRRKRLLFLRELVADQESVPMTPDERREFDNIRSMVQDESIQETHYYDQLSAAWEEVEARL